MTALTCGELAPGEGLFRGESIASCDGRSVLALGEDGDLTLTVGGTVTWSTATTGAGETVVLGTDGDLVVYDTDQEPVFVTQTVGHPDAKLEIGADLALTEDGDTLWTPASGLVDVDSTTKRTHAIAKDR
jgi:hypothetical protein